VQKAFRLMTDGGSIILNASIVASKGLPNWSVYSATKAAVRSFARTTRPHGMPRKQARDTMKSVSNGIPIARFGTADEIANAVVFLRFRRQQLRHRNGIVRGRRLRAGVIGAHLSITWPGRAVAAAS
jgi:NAD(P)-dependent dehydrogenase (short-subunit alcohol dehydrogenase family)